MMKKKDYPQNIDTMFVDFKQSPVPTVIESLCPNCQGNGTTTMLLTKIPFFKQIMLVSFDCPNCGQKNNEVQFVGKLADFGIEIMFKMIQKKDLNRQLIKSQNAKIFFKEIDFEIPLNGKAQITTIQSLLLRAYQQLNFHQPLRKLNQPQNYQKLQVFLKCLKQCLNGQRFPLTMVISDPSGNSMIKNPYAPKLDKNMHITHIPRTVQQLTKMGYNIENAEQQLKHSQQKIVGHKMNFTKPFQEKNFLNQQAVTFEVPCQSCMMPGLMRTCQINIPYFTDIVIMSFSCDYCGCHSVQTKNSGQIKEVACDITLNYTCTNDLKRDLFKSQTCKIVIPQLQLQLDYGTLGGVFTTVEGLLQKIRDHLDQNNPFIDSDKQFTDRMDILLQDLLDMRQGKKKFTLIMIDPLAHSFLQNIYDPDQDKNTKREFRPRTEDQNDMLGITDMKTQNYQQK